jgi:hypothetical protein
MKSKLLAICWFLLITGCSSSKTIDYHKNGLWTFTSNEEVEINSQTPKVFMTLILNKEMLQRKLKNSEKPTLSLPLSDHSLIVVKLEDSGTMSPELAKKFPNIKSYRGYDLADSNIQVRVDCNLGGLYAMIVKGNETYFINPIIKGSPKYIVYNKKNAVKGGNPFADQIIK